MMSGRYRAYPKYKDSGAKWLKDIPNIWSSSKIKHIAKFQVGWTPSTKTDANFEGNNLWVNISDLQTRYLKDTTKKISDAAALAASMDITPKGSLLYSFKLSVGAVSFAAVDMYTNEAIASFLEGGNLPLSYLYYALPIFIIENASTNIYGARILNQELIKNATIIVPSYNEADTIANFLDHETAKIDILIDKQQQLIALLKEKRQAVISHAVTKGLNSDAPMKDSGVEWLGEVPAHWGVTYLTHLVVQDRKIMYGIVLPGPNVDEGVAIVKGGDVKPGRLTLDSLCKTTFEIESNYERSRLWEGDLVYSIRGTIGDVEIVPKEIEGANLTQDAARISPAKGVCNIWLKYAMESKAVFSQLEIGSLGAAVKGINIRDLKKAILPVPPEREMVEIAGYLETVLGKLALLSEKCRQQVEILKECRTALISAAVTGKIDVRNWQPPAANTTSKDSP